MVLLAIPMVNLATAVFPGRKPVTAGLSDTLCLIVREVLFSVHRSCVKKSNNNTIDLNYHQKLLVLESAS